MSYPEAAMLPHHPKRDFYCVPWVYAHAGSGAAPDDLEYRQARFLGSHYCEQQGVPFVQQSVHRHFGHDLLAVSSGSIQFAIEGAEPVTLTPGTILIIPGGNEHRRVVDRDACCCCIELSPDFFYDYLELPDIGSLALACTQRHVEVLADGNRLLGSPMPAVLLTDQRAYRTFLNDFEECLTAYNQVTPLHAHITYTFGALFAQFMLGQMHQASQATVDRSTARRILDVKRWLDRHYNEEIAIPLLAQKANLSPNWFTAAFRQVVGVTPKAYLTTLRLEHALYLLQETELTVTDIAYRVGYGDLANFIHSFEKRYRESPREYRKCHQPNDRGMQSEARRFPAGAAHEE